MRRNVLQQLLLVNKLLNTDMERGLGPLGLTASRTQVLWILGETPGMTQRVLADLLGVTPRNVTGLVDALEETGFVQRRPHPTDRRAIELGLTEKGSAVYAQFQAGLAEMATLLFGDLPAERLALLQETLEQVSAKLAAFEGADQA